MSRTYATAVNIKDALESMRHTDDCIAEIAALLYRINKVKRQLLAQKEYIDRAIIDARSTAYPISRVNLVDYRVKLYKHKNIIGRLKNPDDSYDDTIDEPGNNIEEKEAESRVVMRKKISHRGYKLETNDYVPIFQNDQVLSNLTSELVVGTVFNELDIVGAKQFFIGVNAILTHPNNISETLTPTPYFYRHLVDWNNALNYPDPESTILPAGVYFKNINNLSFTKNNVSKRNAGMEWIIQRSDLRSLTENHVYSNLWVVESIDSWDFTVTFKTPEIDRPYLMISDASDLRTFNSNYTNKTDDRYYTPGLKHALSTGILKGLLMQGNENITGQEASNAIKLVIPDFSKDYTTDTGGFKKIRGFGLD